MARTRVFGRLVRLYSALRELRETRGSGGSALDAASLADALKRHQADRRAVLGGIASLSLGGLGLLPGCDDSDTDATDHDGHDASAPDPDAGAGDAAAPAVRVAIIGGGMAGLHCAYRLKQAGVLATVYDAATRVGGRMFTDRENFGEQVAELGGEFIDSGHTTLHTLAEEFSIQLDDRSAGFDDDTIADVWWVDGQAVPEATVVEQFSAVAPLMADLIYQTDEVGDEALFEELDNTSLADWLDEHVPVDTYPELHAILTSAYRGEYGLEPTEQSVLNLLYLIGHDEPDPFRIFGESDERYHTHDGSQTFIDELERRLEGQIALEHRLTKASGPEAGPYELRFEMANGEDHVMEVDHVVFALPFSVLREVDLDDLELPSDKREMIEAIGYGTNAKLIGAFTARSWRLEQNASGSVTSDEAFQQCWDTSIGQPGTRGILTNYLGGEAGAESGAGDAEALYLDFVAALEQVFEGVEDNYTAGSAVRMHWPSNPFTRGSYACYLPGQWMYWSLEGERVANLHFCGEHTSLEFQGYMEGAAETGARAAGEILEDLGLTPSTIHEALLELRRGLPVRWPNGVPRPVARRRALSARLASRFAALPRA